MKNPYKQYKEMKHLAHHYQDLYLKINHELKDFRKKFETQFAVGHFYSPYPNLKEVKKRQAKLFKRSQKSIPGIDINETKQLKLAQELAAFYPDIPYKANQKVPGWRYYFENSAFDYTDAIMLFGMLRRFQPKRVIEIGSGYSSALMMDVNEHFLNNKMSLTFVEPYPKLLKSVMKPADKRYTIIGKNLSEVSMSTFTKLEAGDILFVDSTHVSKIGSDVNQIFFDILPQLKKGVIIHVHDIFYPFEYPQEWIEETRAWNEGYIVRALLQDSKQYEIILWNHYLNLHHKPLLKKLFPNTQKNIGSGIWLKKL